MELPGASVVFQVPAIPKWVPRPITENAGQHPFAKHPMNDHYPDPGWGWGWRGAQARTLTVEGIRRSSMVFI